MNGESSDKRPLARAADRGRVGPSTAGNKGGWTMRVPAAAMLAALFLVGSPAHSFKGDPPPQVTRTEGQAENSLARVRWQVQGIWPQSEEYGTRMEPGGHLVVLLETLDAPVLAQVVSFEPLVCDGKRVEIRYSQLGQCEEYLLLRGPSRIVIPSRAWKVLEFSLGVVGEAKSEIPVGAACEAHVSLRLIPTAKSIPAEAVDVHVPLSVQH
jgi:hypothetical protein